MVAWDGVKVTEMVRLTTAVAGVGDDVFGGDDDGEVVVLVLVTMERWIRWIGDGCGVVLLRRRRRLEVSRKKGDGARK
ncbi:hypothetical protein Tco_0810971 [Tanacetum coccineum]